MTAADQYVAQAEREWQRLHPLSPVVRTARVAIALALAAVLDLSTAHHGNSNAIRLYVELGLMVLSLGISVVAWLVTRWRIEDGVLRIEGGLIRRTSRRFPPDQIQAVDIVSPAVARIFGLSEVRVRMAASTGTSGRLAYLSEADAAALRGRLLALAHGMAEHTPPPPERVLYQIPTGRLVASVLLSYPGLVVEAVFLGIIVLAVADPSALAAILSGGATSLVLMWTIVFRRINGEYEMTVAESPDGLRLRSGLLQTAAETIPRGRIQAVRMIEPLLWRPFGWCRVVVDVAGKQRSSRENRDVSGSLRAVLPVGDRAQGTWLVDRLMPGAPPPGSAPPSRTKLKSPLRYHYLTWTNNEYYAVTTSGRIRRTTDWVPLAKVQSIRRIEGPVQRRLRVATVHLDTAGRNIHAIARDRDRTESTLLVNELPAVCQVARAAAAS